MEVQQIIEVAQRIDEIIRRLHEAERSSRYWEAESKMFQRRWISAEANNYVLRHAITGWESFWEETMQPLHRLRTYFGNQCLVAQASSLASTFDQLRGDISDAALKESIIVAEKISLKHMLDECKHELANKGSKCDALEAELLSLRGAVSRGRLDTLMEEEISSRDKLIASLKDNNQRLLLLVQQRDIEPQRDKNSILFGAVVPRASREDEEHRLMRLLRQEVGDDARDIISQPQQQGEPPRVEVGFNTGRKAFAAQVSARPGKMAATTFQR